MFLRYRNIQHLKPFSKPFFKPFSSLENFNSSWIDTDNNKQPSNIAKLTYINDTYKYTVKSYMIMAATTTSSAVLCSKSQYLMDSISISSDVLLGSWMIAAIYPIYKIFTFDSVRAKTLTTDMGFIDDSPIERKHNVYKIMGSLGLTQGPLAYFIYATNPAVVPVATALSFSTLYASYIISKRAYDKNIDLVKYEGPLIAGLFGLITVQILSICIGPIISINTQSMIGIGIFSMLCVTDSQSVLKSYDDGILDKYGHSLNLGLNLLNLTQKWAILLTNKKE